MVVNEVSTVVRQIPLPSENILLYSSSRAGGPRSGIASSATVRGDHGALEARSGALNDFKADLGRLRPTGTARGRTGPAAREPAGSPEDRAALFASCTRLGW
jgi:hypothetical protein